MKIFTKLLATKLNLVVKNINTNTQCEFIKGMSVIENLQVVNHYLYKNNKSLKLFSRRKELKLKHINFKKQFSKYRRLKKSKLILLILRN